MNQEIEKLLENGLIEKTKTDYIREKFQDFTAVAEEWSGKANLIVVTDETQKELMSEAREGRLLLKAKRIEVEKVRKALKEQSLSEGRMIDTIAKHLTSLIEPAEKHLEFQEKFIEIQDQNRRIKLKQDRTALLQPYTDVIDPDSIQLDLITDEAFNTILNGAKFTQNAKKEEALRIENENKEKARKQKLLQERTVKLAEYKQFYNNSTDLILTTETEESVFNEFEQILKARKAEYDKAQEKIRKENEALKKQNAKKAEEIKSLKKEIKQTPTNVSFSLNNTDVCSETIMVSKVKYEELQKKYQIAKFVLDSILAYIVPQNLRDLANKAIKEISEIEAVNKDTNNKK
jgi:hypothetical protein